MDEKRDNIRPMDEHTLFEVGSDASKKISKGASETGGTTEAVLRFGQAVVVDELGQGGMGKVYRGKHTGLDVDVAIKVMSEQIAKDPAARQRFLREARTAAKLDHPNIVRVLDVAEQEGTPYILLEFVDGSDLSSLLKRHGKLDPFAILRALGQVAEGLAHAHEQGIVHRDIKPHNIFVAKNGRVKLGDFGLARAVEQTTELTVPGAAMGTAHYMSPEQASGQDIDQRSDIYSLGVTAWHLLVGVTPYRGTTPLSIAVQHVNNDVPYDRAKFGHLPDPVVYLLMAMTNREPARRPTATRVAAQLREILSRATGNGDLRLSSMEALWEGKKRASDSGRGGVPSGQSSAAVTPVRSSAPPSASRPQTSMPPPPVHRGPHGSVGPAHPVGPGGGMMVPPGYGGAHTPSMPQPSVAAPTAWQPPVQAGYATPHSGQPPAAPASSSSNMGLWIALIVAFLVLMSFGGCTMMAFMMG